MWLILRYLAGATGGWTAQDITTGSTGDPDIQASMAGWWVIMENSIMTHQPTHWIIQRAKIFTLLKQILTILLACKSRVAFATENF